MSLVCTMMGLRLTSFTHPLELPLSWYEERLNPHLVCSGSMIRCLFLICIKFVLLVIWQCTNCNHTWNSVQCSLLHAGLLGFYVLWWILKFHCQFSWKQVSDQNFPSGIMWVVHCPLPQRQLQPRNLWSERLYLIIKYCCSVSSALWWMVLKRWSIKRLSDILHRLGI